MFASLFFSLICLTILPAVQDADDPVGRSFDRWQATTDEMRKQDKPPSRENLGAAADEALRELNIERLSLEQLERLINDDNVTFYEGRTVTVVGVTSVQGRHTGPDGQVDCSNDEQKEFALMGEFMEQKSMTWPVAFSKEPVLNPACGIRGIPHVTIIDPAGVVRYNVLHPGTPLEGKISKIDALLKEFKR